MEQKYNWVDFYTQDFSENSGPYTSIASILSNATKKTLMGNYNMKKINDHLYSINFATLDEKEGIRYASSHFDHFACSSVRNGNFYGRNFDWYYDNSVEFLVRIGASEKRYASIGISGLVEKLTDVFVPRYKYSNIYETIPYLMLDGINEKGVIANINVVPAGEAGSGKITTGTKKGKKRIPQNYLVRYILDNYASAKEAVEAIKNDLDIYAPQIETLSNYEIHCMIGDKDENYIVEFIDNEVKVIEGDRANIMTNFHIYGTNIKGGKVDWTSLTKFGSGYERYNLALANYVTLNDLDRMKSFMRDTIRYSNAYTNEEGDDFWYTEFVGNYGTYSITIEDCINRIPKFHDYLIPKVKNMYENKNRSEKNVWITCHSTVYDIKNKILWLTTQEGDEANDLGFGFNSDLDYLININNSSQLFQ